MAGKRYYWLKLPEDFFRRSYIRRLRSMEGGDRLTLIYLEMLLAALKTDGVLTADGAEDFAEELALELYEDPVEVQTALTFLSERGKITHENDDEYYLTDCEELTGSEGDSAKRMRELRRRDADSAALPDETAMQNSGAVKEQGDHSFSRYELGKIPVPPYGRLCLKEN